MAVVTTTPHDPILDLDAWVGQRSCRFEFHLTDAVSKQKLGQFYPLRGGTLTHDTGRTIKRQLQIELGAADTAAINTLTDRVSPYIVFGNGASYPLGRYMFVAPEEKEYTSGNLSTQTLNDEMFLVDQPLTQGIGTGAESVSQLVRETLRGLNIKYKIESSGYISFQSWSVGTTRGQILEALTTTGDYFSPWFDNDGVFRMIRTFNPARKTPDIDLDNGYRVMRASITKTTDLITAPNRFLVVGTGALSGNVGSNSTGSAITAVADVSPAAPNSVRNRGFAITQVQNINIADPTQASVVAAGLAQKNTVFERVSLTTPPDPRHDSYNVIWWDGNPWLELSWSMALVEGGTMNHILRKAYVE